MFWTRKTPEEKAAEQRAAIRAQAMKQVRKARAGIGEETLDIIKTKMLAQQDAAKAKAAPTRQQVASARAQILAMDKARVADNIKLLLEER